MKHTPITKTPATPDNHHDWLRQENIGLRERLRDETARNAILAARLHELESTRFFDSCAVRR